MMQYYKILASFLFAASIGIVASLVFVSNNEKFSRKRLLREIFGGIWISAIAYVGLDHFTDWNTAVILGIVSIVAFTNSRIISFIGKDLMEAVFSGIVNYIKGLSERSKIIEEPPVEEDPDNLDSINQNSLYNAN